MGTFHEDRGELHGMTVVVETRDSRVLVGQHHEERGGRLVLLHADEHVEGREGLTREEFVRRAERLGPWPRHPRLVVPSSEIRAIRRLS